MIITISDLCSKALALKFVTFSRFQHLEQQTFWFGYLLICGHAISRKAQALMNVRKHETCFGISRPASLAYFASICPSLSTQFLVA